MSWADSERVRLLGVRAEQRDEYDDPGWHDIAFLLARLGRVEAIITDLAQQTEPTYVYVTVTGEEQERCALCDARLSLSPNPLAQHKESCEWRRAVDYRKDMG